MQVKIPFFVLHGEADTVTDPEVSRALYEQASSKDKTIKLYPGMWHGLTSGEPDDNVEIVFTDIIAWLDKRSGSDYDRNVSDSSSFENIVTMAPTAARVTQKQQPGPQPQQPRRANGTYLCGWKGRRMHHHSAM